LLFLRDINYVFCTQSLRIMAETQESVEILVPVAKEVDGAAADAVEAVEAAPPAQAAKRAAAKKTPAPEVAAKRLLEYEAKRAARAAAARLAGASAAAKEAIRRGAQRSRDAVEAAQAASAAAAAQAAPAAAAAAAPPSAKTLARAAKRAAEADERARLREDAFAVTAAEAAALAALAAEAAARVAEAAKNPEQYRRRYESSPAEIAEMERLVRIAIHIMETATMRSCDVEVYQLGLGQEAHPLCDNFVHRLRDMPYAKCIDVLIGIGASSYEAVCKHIRRILQEASSQIWISVQSTYDEDPRKCANPRPSIKIHITLHEDKFVFAPEFDAE
jgi:hypothetical protein